MTDRHTRHARSTEDDPLRDDFAGQIAAGLVSRDVVESPEVIARRAYAVADALLVAKTYVPPETETPPDTETPPAPAPTPSRPRS
jgi:hypothetical protein